MVGVGVIDGVEVGVNVGVKVGGSGVRVAAGELVPQEARTKITTIERIIFTVDMVPSFTFRLTMSPHVDNIPFRDDVLCIGPRAA